MVLYLWRDLERQSPNLNPPISRVTCFFASQSPQSNHRKYDQLMLESKQKERERVRVGLYFLPLGIFPSEMTLLFVVVAFKWDLSLVALHLLAFLKARCPSLFPISLPLSSMLSPFRLCGLNDNKRRIVVHSQRSASSSRDARYHQMFWYFLNVKAGSKASQKSGSDRMVVRIYWSSLRLLPAYFSHKSWLRWT